MSAEAGPYCGLCGQSEDVCGRLCAASHTLDPPRWCTVCGHRLDVQVYPNRVDSSCKVCRVRARRAAEQAQQQQ